MKLKERLAPTLALSSVVLLASLMGNDQGGYFTLGWVPAAFVLVAMVFAVSIAGAGRALRGRAGLLALGLFCAYVAWTFASIFWAADKGSAWLGAGQTMLYLLAFWAALVLISLDASRRFVLVASSLGPAVIAAFTLLALQSRVGGLMEGGWLVGTVGYHNGEAAFLLVPFWVSIYLAGSRMVNPLIRGLVIGGATLCTQLAVLTESRGAMVAIFGSLLIFFLISGARLRGVVALLPVVASLGINFHGLNDVYIVSSGGGNPAALLESALPRIWLLSAGSALYGLTWAVIDRGWTPPRRLVRAVGAVVLVFCTLSVVAGGAVAVDRYGNPIDLAHEKWVAFKTNDTSGAGQSRYLSASGSGRYVLWQVAWKDFEAHPLLGVGTQNYEATYYRLRQSEAGSVRQPHSLPLEVLAERGVVGAGLFFGFLFVCVGTGLWRRFRSLSPEGRAQAGALSASVAYWFFHSSAEWFWQIPAITMPAIVYLALLVSPWGNPEVVRVPTRGWPMRLTGAGVAALAAAVLVPLAVSAYYLQQSKTAVTPEKALVFVNRAERFNPLDSQIPDEKARIALELGRWKTVVEAYKREIRLNPENYAPYMYLGDYYARRGDDTSARTYYREALHRNPLDVELERKASSMVRDKTDHSAG